VASPRTHDLLFPFLVPSLRLLLPLQRRPSGLTVPQPTVACGFQFGRHGGATNACLGTIRAWLHGAGSPSLGTVQPRSLPMIHRLHLVLHLVLRLVMLLRPQWQASTAWMTEQPSTQDPTLPPPLFLGSNQTHPSLAEDAVELARATDIPPLSAMATSFHVQSCSTTLLC
jgi:hypothetical protein